MTEGVKSGVPFACRIAVFLSQASSRPVGDWQHVGAKITELISLDNGYLRAQISEGFYQHLPA
jgi:hypothetical protein